MPLTPFDVAEPETLAPAAGASCDRCGAPVDPRAKYCNACGIARAPTPPVKGKPSDSASLSKHFRCETCGAEMQADAETRSYTCPFCASNYVIEIPAEVSGREPPEFIIGFAVTPEQANEKFREWLGKNPWFRPGDLRLATVQDALKGIYIPFWSFTMLARSEWSARIGEHWYRTETYTTMVNGKLQTRTRQVQETEWWELSGKHHQYYSGYLLSASHGLAQADALRIVPFRLASLERYSPSFIAGWLCEECQVEREAALVLSKEEFLRQNRQDVAAFLPGDTHSNLEVTPDFDDTGSDLILLPIYMLSYRYQDKIYRFLMNGQTGQVAGDKPVSRQRIAGAVIGAVVAALVFFLILYAMSR